MNETFGKEINLKWLLYRALRAWKAVVVWALIISLICGLGAAALKLMQRTDKIFVQEEKQNFEREYTAWAARGESLTTKLQNLEIERDREAQYNEDSVIMQIDPSENFKTTFYLYVYYDYTLILGTDANKYNPDRTNEILGTYSAYMNGGELYNYILGRLTYDMASYNLSEIISASVDNTAKMISVTVTHVDAAKCRELASLVEEGIYSHYETACANYAQHTIEITNWAESVIVNTALEDLQKSNIQRVTDLDVEIYDTNEALLEWKAEPRPEYKYDTVVIIKDSIKTAVIGGVIGFAVLFFGVAIAAMLSGKLLNPEDIKSCFGVRVIGVLPASRKKRAFEGITRKFAKVGGVKIKQSEYESLAKAIGFGIKSDAASRANGENWKTIAFTGVISAEDMERAVAAMGIDGYNVICAPDMLTNAESVNKVASADCVVLVEAQEKGVIDDIEKELDALKAWNKPVLGAVVINADAIV